MASEFSTEFFSANRIVKADLRAARTPREEDLERIKKEVAKLYDATEVILNVTVDDSLLSGYVLQIGDRVFDNSGRHAIDQMMADKPSLATLKTRIEDYKPAATSEEGGVVISSADGIVEVEGMDRAVYGEIVTFENGAKGMVESVEPGRSQGQPQSIFTCPPFRILHKQAKRTNKRKNEQEYRGNGLQHDIYKRCII